jgi:hypothetical protein
VTLISGDRVQWFRAEANMERWREEVEAKLAELRTTSRSFAMYKKAVWTRLADEQLARDPTKLGRIAYAKQKANMFGTREQSARDALRSYPEYAGLADDDADLVKLVLDTRQQHATALASVMSSAKEAAGVDPGTDTDTDTDMAMDTS